MFTGIIEELGKVASFESRGTGARLVIHCSKITEDLTEGASISVNGVCLTALSPSPASFAADLAPETLSRSNLGELRNGSVVNLERAVTPITRLSGHIVQGHVDAPGEVLTFDPLGDGNYWLRIKLPLALDRYLVEKGSISIDGISLTIARLEPGPIVNITIIPHTAGRTTLGTAKTGARVNIEVDVLAKHVEKLLGFQRDSETPVVR